eukprot:g12731.t1
MHSSAQKGVDSVVASEQKDGARGRVQQASSCLDEMTCNWLLHQELSENARSMLARPGRRREGRTRHMIDASCSSLVKVLLCVCVCAEGIFAVLLVRADGCRKHSARFPVFSFLILELILGLVELGLGLELLCSVHTPTSKPADLNREAPAAKNELDKAEAEATGTEKDVGLARRKVDFALEGVASAQNGVTSLQELVDACTKQWRMCNRIVCMHERVALWSWLAPVCMNAWRGFCGAGWDVWRGFCGAGWDQHADM